MRTHGVDNIAVVWTLQDAPEGSLVLRHQIWINTLAANFLRLLLKPQEVSEHLYVVYRFIGNVDMVFISIFLSIPSGLLILSDVKKCLKSNSLSSFAILLIRLTMTILEIVAALQPCRPLLSSRTDHHCLATHYYYFFFHI